MTPDSLSSYERLRGRAGAASPERDEEPGEQSWGEPNVKAAAATWFEDGDWDDADIPARAWIAVGYFLRGSVTQITGPAGVSKSMLMVFYTVALALGRDIHGMRPIHACRCMIYNVEDDALEQRRRFTAALIAMGRNSADIAGKVARIGPSRLGMLLTRDPETGQLTHTAAWIELEEKIEAFRPDVLILDPLAELHGEDENANVRLREVVAEFRALAVKHKLALVLVHHTRKGPAAPGDMDAGRGASSIAGAARVVLTINGMSEDEATAFGLSTESRKHFFRVDGAKSNYAALSDAEWFERVSYTLANGDTVAVPSPWKPPVDVVSMDTRLAIESAVAAGSNSGPWSAKLSNDARSIKHLFIQHGITTVPGQRAAVASLYAAGFVSAEFRRSDNRVKAQGLRSPDGQPSAALWTDDVPG